MQDDSKKTASELSMDNVGGVFVVLMAGMGLGTLNHHSTKVQSIWMQGSWGAVLRIRMCRIRMFLGLLYPDLD